MKNIIFCLLAFASLCIISCSDEDPCADLNCGTGTCVDGTCDCPDGFSGVNCEIEDLCFNANCVNGTCDEDTGDCICNEGYEGENCEVEQRAKYLGTWNSTDFSCDGDPGEAVTLIIEAGDEILEVKVIDPSEPDIEVISVVDGDTFTIAPQVFTVNGGALEITISGSGSLQDGVMTLDIKQEGQGFEIKCLGTFTM